MRVANCALENATCNPQLSLKITSRIDILITTLACHDVQHQFVRLVHALGTDTGEVADASIHVVIDDAFY